MLYARVLHQLLSKRRDAGFGNLADYAQRPERPQKTWQHLLASQQWKIRFPGDVIRTVAKDLDDNVRSAKDRTAVAEDLRSAFGVQRIRVASLRTGATLNKHFESSPDEIWAKAWDQGNAPLTPDSSRRLHERVQRRRQFFVAGKD